MAARHTAAGGDFEDILKFLVGLGTVAGLALTVWKFFR